MYFCKKTISSAACALLLFSGQSSAAIFNISDSGNLLATLEVTQNTNTEYLFDLSFLSNGGNANNSVIDLFFIDSSPASQPVSLNVQSTTGNVTDPSIVGSGTTIDTSFNYDYGFDFADNGNGRFQVGESKSWIATFNSGPVTFDDLGVVIRNNGGQQPKDAFAAAAAPIPEPTAYMMFLSGLGLLGFAARRRKS